MSNPQMHASESDVPRLALRPDASAVHKGSRKQKHSSRGRRVRTGGSTGDLVLARQRSGSVPDLTAAAGGEEESEDSRSATASGARSPQMMASVDNAEWLSQLVSEGLSAEEENKRLREKVQQMAESMAQMKVEADQQLSIIRKMEQSYAELMTKYQALVMDAGGKTGRKDIKSPRGGHRSPVVEKKKRQGFGTLRAPRRGDSRARHRASTSGIDTKMAPADMARTPSDILNEGLKHRAFGLRLADFYDRGITIPQVVTSTVGFLKMHASLETADLFRRDVNPGDARRLEALLEFGEAIPKDIEVYLVGFVIKDYFARLPEPLIPPDMQLDMIKYVEVDDEKARSEALRSAIFGLLYNHRLLLQYVVSFFSKMADKIGAENVLEPFAPLVFRREGLSSEQACGIADETFYAKAEKVIAMLMADHSIFPMSDSSRQYMIKDGVLYTKSATVEALLARLVDPFARENDFEEVCLGLYQTFIETSPLLEFYEQQHKLFERDLNDVVEDWSWRAVTREHIARSFQRLLILNPHILTGSEYPRRVKRLVSSWVKATKEAPAEKKVRRWLKQQLKKTRNSKTPRALKSSSNNATGQSTIKRVLDVEVHTLAQQMTLIDAELLRAIPRIELLGKRFNKGKEQAPHWTEMVERFNVWSRWVMTEILSESLPSSRAQIIVQFIKLAHYLKTELNSFNASYAVVAALHEPAIERLKDTWGRITQSSLDCNRELEQFWSVSRNFRNYRNGLEKAMVEPPCIPYIGLVGKDLFGVEEGNKDTRLKYDGVDHINVEKLRLLWQSISPFVSMQKKAMYPKLEEDENVMFYLNSLGPELLTEKEAKTKSVELEPRK